MSLTREQQRLVESVLERIRALARHFAYLWPSVNGDDLEGEGRLAATEAALRYDASIHESFDAFAYKRYRGAMIDHARKILRDVPKVMAQIADTERRDEGGALEGPDLLADILSDAPAEASVVHSLRRQATVMVASLVGTLGSGGEAEWIEHMGAQLARQEIERGIASVDETDATFIRGFYFEGKTLNQIAAQLNVSKRTVQRIHDHAKGMLHAWLVRAGVAEGEAHEALSRSGPPRT